MIDKKKIKAAANNYAALGPNDLFTMERYASFQDGAHWAQEEFVKSLWHEASETPMQNRHIIALSKAQMVVYDFEFTKEKEWKKDFQQCKIVRWAYLDDILPKKGGEE